MNEDRQTIIEKNAYFKWNDAGRPPGDGLEFWVAAEKEYLYHDIGSLDLPVLSPEVFVKDTINFLNGMYNNIRTKVIGR